jgi:hypothetical protein
MKTLLTRYSVLALMFATLGLASCTEESSPDSPNNLAATSLSSTSIKVRWDKSTSSDDVIVTPTSGGTAVTLTSANGAATITGLTLGQTYTIQIKNDNGSSSILTWAPARRWPSEANPSQTVRVYSTGAAAPNKPSGLIFNGTEIRAVSIRSADSDNIDLVVAFNAAIDTPISFVSPGVFGSGIETGKQTLFGDENYVVAGGLDNDFYTGSITGLFSDGNNAVDIVRRLLGSSAIGLPLIVLARTQESGNVHYARIELVPQPDGQAFGVEDTYEFVDLKISYQTIPNAGYVGRPQAHGSWVKKTAPAPIIKN